ncbi:MAG: efflux RND transporter periplasmic adaptor subunit, partial [Balneolaceae bacterium]
KVETAKAEIRTITQIVSASGRIQPEVEVIIRPDVSGEIIELTVNEGDFVQKGDLLLRIKPDIYLARIDELNAALLTQKSRMEQARAQMLQAEVEYLKNKKLFETNNISELEFLQAENNYKAQQANLKATEYQIESAQAQLRRAEEELQQTVIRAPQDGTISSLTVERGERVLGNTQTAGTEMLRIARMNQMEVVVDVNENDIVNVSENDTSIIEVDAYPNRSFEGIVTEIANSAIITGSGSAEQVTNYKVKVRITTPHNLNMTGNKLAEEPAPELVQNEPGPNFKPGMSATVDIKTKTAYNVVSVPIQAVTVRDVSELKSSENDSSIADSPAKEDLRRVVFKVVDGIARIQEVETGISDNTHIQIMSGIDKDDEIVIGSYRILSRELADNDRVEVISLSQQLASR